MPGRPADQPGVRNTAALVGLEQRALGFGVSEQRGRFARTQDVAVGVVLAHGAIVSAALGCGQQALLDGGPDALRHHVARRAAVDDDAALGLAFREPEIGLAQSLVKFDRLRLEAVGRALAAPALGARQSDRRRNVEDEGEIGHGRADRHAFEAANELLSTLPSDALIDARGIDEAVADHPFAVDQRRANGRAHVIVARGREQDRLGLRRRAAWRRRTREYGG